MDTFEIPPAGNRLDDPLIRRLAKIDLNLLVVFSALMRDKSVTAAAARLCLGQPAVSASLKRLRSMFSDPLFVKSGRSLVATERALTIWPPVEKILAQINSVAFDPPSFDPATAQSTVRIGLSDDNEILFLPAIVRALQRSAPRIRLVARPVSHRDIGDSLDRDEIDVGLSVFGELSTWHCEELAFEQGYGCIFDPAQREAPTAFNVDEFIHCKQVIVTFDGALRSKVDRILAARQLERDVRFGTTRFATLPYLIQGTDLVASLPEMVGRVLAGVHGLSYRQLPIDLPPSRPRLVWHRRNDLDPANRWLRSLILFCIRDVLSTITVAQETGRE